MIKLFCYSAPENNCKANIFGREAGENFQLKSSRAAKFIQSLFIALEGGEAPCGEASSDTKKYSNNAVKY